MCFKKLGKYITVEEIDFNRINELILDIMAGYAKQTRTKGIYNYVPDMFRIDGGIAKLDKHKPEEKGDSKGVIRLKYIYRKPDKNNHPPLKDQKNAELRLKVKYELKSTLGTGNRESKDWEKITGTTDDPPVIKMQRTKKFASILLVNSLIRALNNHLEKVRIANKPKKGAERRGSNKITPIQEQREEEERERDREEKRRNEIKEKTTINATYNTENTTYNIEANDSLFYKSLKPATEEEDEESEEKKPEKPKKKKKKID